MQIGTYVIAISVLLLIVNGPTAQDYGDTTFEDLVTEYHAMVWIWILVISMLISGMILACVDLTTKGQCFKYTTLLVARASAFALNLSTGKAVILPTSSFWLTSTIVVKVVSGIVYTHAIVVQSTTVEQKLFVPINAAVIVFVNAFTGIIVWEDWKVVQDWLGYICVFLLLVMGCGLLLGDLGLLQETQPETFRGARPSLLSRQSRIRMIDNLKRFGDKIQEEPLDGFDIENALISPECHSVSFLSSPPELASSRSFAVRQVSMPISEDGSRKTDGSRHTERSFRSRTEAWRSVYEAGRPARICSVNEQARTKSASSLPPATGLPALRPPGSDSETKRQVSFGTQREIENSSLPPNRSRLPTHVTEENMESLESIPSDESLKDELCERKCSDRSKTDN